ncbi:vicilin-like seed storage protein At2g18540 [Temnothorax curvispinosus]|uniref:Vicilin-like seed storage protein At2g18540 n=1 Tax=Temnothorax curvispinosus TaxID=300111 RepID=A0A6J1QHT1_9HYME|nr:vicilin-like seed storage protein At2g18540 [Temnothorax curvispinosus]
MVRDELEREKMGARASKRAWKFERKLEEGRGGRIAKKCLEEMKERWKKERIIGRWEQERKEYWEGIGVEKGGEEGLTEEAIEHKEKAKQRQERMGKIMESKYNRWYKRIRKDGIPEYLKKGWEEARWNRIARFRLGNEIREGLYWGKEEDKKCRICEKKEETWEHVWEECSRWEDWEGESWQDVVEKIMSEKGEGEEWMKTIEEMRSGGGGRKKRLRNRWLRKFLISDKVKEKGSTGQKEGMEFRAKVTVEREMLEKMIRDQAKETLRALKEEVKDQREEIENLKRKIRRLEMGAGKRKRDESADNRGRQEEMKWWSDDDERNEDERRRKNIIIRVERNRWMGKGTNWEKVRQLLSEELKLRVEMKEVSVIGLRGEWLTMLVRLGSEEEKWRVLEARRRAGSRLKVKMDEDKSVERRIREGEEKKRRKERRGEDDGRTKGSEEDEIASELEKSLLMETEEEKEKTKTE